MRHGPMVGFTAILILMPLVLCTWLLALATAVLVWRQRPSARVTLLVGRLVLFLLWAAGAGSAILSGILRPDWVHDFWGAQVPMCAAFLGCGLLLCGVWGDDAALFERVATSSPGTGSARHRRLANPAWTFLGMLLVSALVPLVLQLAFPEEHATHRGTGRPVHDLVELAHWGLGGPLPALLEPSGDAGHARGIDFLPRDVTVPMGATLIAAWLWILFCALAWVGRLVRAPRRRIVLLLLAPPVVGLLSPLASWPLGVLRLGFDPRFFWPLAARDSGIWTSDPATMQSYGRVLLVAALCAVLLAASRVVQGARRRTAA